jgi:hypothetical protein
MKIMKLKNITALALITFMSFAVSCTKELDQEPQYAFEDIEIKSLNEVETILGGVYAKLRSVNYYGSSNGSSGFSTMPDMLSDNFYETGESLANYSQLSSWYFTSDDAWVEATWQDAYDVIVQANYVITFAEKFKAENPKKANRLKGQALAVRAYVHFDILRYWGESFDRNSTQWGVAYKEDFDKLTTPKRLTVKDSYDKIYADLNQALLLLSDVDKAINTSSSKSKIDLTAAKAFAARLNLYSKNYSQAITYATDVIASQPVPSINDTAAYRALWKDVNTYDQLWTVSFDPGQGSPADNIYFARGNRASYRATPQIRNAYTVGDVRPSVFFRILPTNRGTLRDVFVKFLEGRTGLKDGSVNWKVIRLSEVYLIRAEAYATRNNAGDEALALADLNVIRSARIANYVPGTETGTALLDAIELERSKELLGEGHRFFDLKRTDRDLTRLNTGETLDPTDRSWAWPIPFDEINVSGMPQNEGY